MSPKSFPKEHRRLEALVRELAIELPTSVQSFSDLHKKSLQDCALSRKIKELMALTISITTPCAGCIAYHVHDAIEAGATREEVIEAIGVAIMMGGGPGLVYGCEAYEALNQFESEMRNIQQVSGSDEDLLCGN